MADKKWNFMPTVEAADSYYLPTTFAKFAKDEEHSLRKCPAWIKDLSTEAAPMFATIPSKASNCDVNRNLKKKQSTKRSALERLPGVVVDYEAKFRNVSMTKDSNHSHNSYDQRDQENSGVVKNPGAYSSKQSPQEYKQELYKNLSTPLVLDGITESEISAINDSSTPLKIQNQQIELEKTSSSNQFTFLQYDPSAIRLKQTAKQKSMITTTQTIHTSSTLGTNNTTKFRLQNYHPQKQTKTNPSANVLGHSNVVLEQSSTCYESEKYTFQNSTNQNLYQSHNDSRVYASGESHEVLLEQKTSRKSYQVKPRTGKGSKQYSNTKDSLSLASAPRKSKRVVSVAKSSMSNSVTTSTSMFNSSTATASTSSTKASESLTVSSPVTVPDAVLESSPPTRATSPLTTAPSDPPMDELNPLPDMQFHKVDSISYTEPNSKFTSESVPLSPAPLTVPWRCNASESLRINICHAESTVRNQVSNAKGEPLANLPTYGSFVDAFKNIPATEGKEEVIESTRSAALQSDCKINEESKEQKSYSLIANAESLKQKVSKSSHAEVIAIAGKTGGMVIGINNQSEAPNNNNNNNVDAALDGEESMDNPDLTKESINESVDDRYTTPPTTSSVKQTSKVQLIDNRSSSHSSSQNSTLTNRTKARYTRQTDGLYATTTVSQSSTVDNANIGIMYISSFQDQTKSQKHKIKIPPAPNSTRINKQLFPSNTAKMDSISTAKDTYADLPNPIQIANPNLETWRQKWLARLRYSHFCFANHNQLQQNHVVPRLRNLGCTIHSVYKTHLITHFIVDYKLPQPSLYRNVKVWSFEKLMRFLDLLDPTGRDPSDWHQLKSPYLLVWDLTRKHRTLMCHQYSANEKWPRLEFRSNGRSPFVVDRTPLQGDSEQNVNKPAEVSATATATAVVAVATTAVPNTTANAVSKQTLLNKQKRKRLYCENCTQLFSNMEEHTNSASHKYHSEFGDFDIIDQVIPKRIRK